MVYEVSPLISMALIKMNNKRESSALFPSTRRAGRGLRTSPFAAADLAVPPAACSKEGPCGP